MSSPKPTPTRRGTLFGLRRKSSVASFTPSVGAPAADAPLNGGANAQAQEPTATNDTISINSKTDKRSPKKRAFTLLPTRSSADSTRPEASELSDGSSDHGLNVNAKASSSSSRGFLRRLSSSKKHTIEELTQEKQDLEARVQALSSEKSTLEAALEAAKAEAQRLTHETTKNGNDWDVERRKIWDEAAAQLVEKEGEVKSLAATLDELKAELERVKASEQDLLAYKESSTLELEAKLAALENRVRDAVKEEKEGLEIQLFEAQTSVDAKDRTIKELGAHVTGLQEQLTVAQLEVKRLKEERASWEAEKAIRLVQAAPSRGWMTGWCSVLLSWITYGYVRATAGHDESARYGLAHHPSSLYLS